MKKLRGCIVGLIYTGLLLGILGASSYFWFKFWVRGESIPTPQLVGRTISDARAVASDLGLIVIVDESKDRHGENIPEGSVVWQNRAAGVLIKRGTRLHIGRSLGPLILKVPDVRGADHSDGASPAEPGESAPGHGLVLSSPRDDQRRGD